MQKLLFKVTCGEGYPTYKRGMINNQETFILRTKIAQPMLADSLREHGFTCKISVDAEAGYHQLEISNLSKEFDSATDGVLYSSFLISDNTVMIKPEKNGKSDIEIYGLLKEE